MYCVPAWRCQLGWAKVPGWQAMTWVLLSCCMQLSLPPAATLLDPCVKRSPAVATELKAVHCTSFLISLAPRRLRVW
jgi:hypothetical protein